MMPGDGNRGTSLVEVLVAAAIFATVAALLFDFAAVSGRIARTEPDAADASQRLRVAVGVLERELRAAGAAAVNGSIGSLVGYLPPIIPARTGALMADEELTAFDDRISIVAAPYGAWTARLSSDLASPLGSLQIDETAAGCPAAGRCGFLPGTRAVIFDISRLGAGYDLFSATATTSGLEHGAPNPPFSKLYSAASTVVMPVDHRVIFHERSTQRLMLYDGFKTTLPLVDHVTDMKLAYFVDPLPASAPRPAEAAGNCVFGPGEPPAPLLKALPSITLAEMPLEEFTDGPVCGVAPNRFDGDLLRIRRVRVTIRLADPASSLEREVTLSVAPRNMAAAR